MTLLTIYLEDAKVALYVVPKAASSSIKRTIAAIYKEGDEGYKDTMRRLRKLRDAGGYYKIAICRDPWERALSIYSEKIIDNAPNQRIIAHGFKRFMKFKDFVKRLHSVADEGADKHIKSQHYIVFRDGPPDLLCRVENLKEDWLKVQDIVKRRGGRLLPELPMMNKSRSEKLEWEEETYKLISERYAEDIELLGYKRE